MNNAPSETNSGPLRSRMGDLSRNKVPSELRKAWKVVLRNFEELPPEMQNGVAQTIRELGKLSPDEALYRAGIIVVFYAGYVGDLEVTRDPVGKAQELDEVLRLKIKIN